MNTISVETTASALSTNTPNAVISLAFNYTGTTTQGGTTIYYAARLSDGETTEDVLFPLSVTAGSVIPASEEFAYTPAVTFANTVTATDGRVFYTAQ